MEYESSTNYDPDEIVFIERLIYLPLDYRVVCWGSIVSVVVV